MPSFSAGRFGQSLPYVFLMKINVNNVDSNSQFNKRSGAKTLFDTMLLRMWKLKLVVRKKIVWKPLGAETPLFFNLQTRVTAFDFFEKFRDL